MRLDMPSLSKMRPKFSQDCTLRTRTTSVCPSSVQNRSQASLNLAISSSFHQASDHLPRERTLNWLKRLSLSVSRTDPGESAINFANRLGSAC